MLRKALTDWPKSGRPVEFDLEVVEDTAPTADQVPLIMSYLPSKPTNVASAFMSAHPASTSVGAGFGVDTAPDHGQVSNMLSELMRKNPNALKWPIVVDWMGGRASIGDLDGVRAILDAIWKEQSGSVDDAKPEK